MYRVILQYQPRQFFADADRPLARKLAHGLRILEQTPHRHPNIKALSGPLAGHFRLRAGDYRLVYLVDETSRQVQVVRIAHRSEAYR
jgi:mRNA interferase RelE/StbE